MDIKTIKGIDMASWRRFKMAAAEKNVALGELFKIMLNDYSNRGEDVWDKIINGDRLLSDKEADEFENTVRKMRKEKGFRE